MLYKTMAKTLLGRKSELSKAVGCLIG